MRGRISILVSVIFILKLFIINPVHAQGTWRQINTGITDQINGSFAATPSLITIVTNMGNALHTTDGGQTWHHNQLMPGQSFNSVAGFYDPLNSQMPAVAVGDDGSKWYSNDGGQNWSRSDFQTTNDIFDVTVNPSSTDANNVDFWASGQDGTVFHSSNSGTDWHSQMVQYQSENLYGISFGNANNGIIGGNWWILYGTTNGGSQWNYQSSPVDNVDFFGVAMGSAYQGWAVGTGGTIIHTSNGGSNWTQQTSGTTNTLNDVLFGSESNGWTVGNNGTVLYTTNGGSNWNSQTTGFTGDFLSIAIDNEGNAYITGENGALFTNAPAQSSNLTVDKQQLNFAVTPINDPPENSLPDFQTVYVNGPGGTEWSTRSFVDFLNLTPPSGTAPGFFTVTLNAAGLSPGSYQGTVYVTETNNPDASEIQVAVDLEIKNINDPPFGQFITPAEGSTFRSSVPVTGWVLDDSGVENVKIYREDGSGMVYIGDAAMVEGARPDIETSYPNYPNNYKAGWGYMLLTNFLPNGGNGTYTLTAVAKDKSGASTTLGTKTIMVDNANAVKPFGAIDTPQQGGTASGSSYINWGWALTPPPNTISPCGSLIDVYIDGTKVGNPVYNIYRSDIANMFPNYTNSTGAVGYFNINTTQYDNGVHSIYWSATDDAGNNDGIGSRFFTISNSNRNIMDDVEGTPFIILNSAGPIIQPENEKLNFGAHVSGNYISDLKCNIDRVNSETPNIQFMEITNGGQSPLNWEATTDDNWITLNPVTGTAPDWLAIIVNPSGLGAGDYEGLVTITDADESCPPAYIQVYLTVYSDTEAPFGEFNFPDMDRTVSGTINISGWALDDIGVESVQVFRQDGNEMILLGDANLIRNSRPDIEHVYSNYPFNNYAGWSLNFSTNTLPDGEYYFEAAATDYEGNTTILEGSNFTIDNTNAVIPFGDIDAPAPGEIISGDSYEISGWVLTPLPNTIPTNGSTIFVDIDGVYIGHPQYNIARADIAALFPGYNNSNGPGATLEINTTEYSDGVHTIKWRIFDDQNNANGDLGSREFVIQNNSNITVDVDEGELEIPKETELLNAYPNPFNPSTTIGFKLSKDEKVNVTVFDILGRKVVTLINDEFKSAGSYNIYWNGKNEHGLRLTSGIYLVVMNAGSYMKTQKIMLLK